MRWKNEYENTENVDKIHWERITPFNPFGDRGQKIERAPNDPVIIMDS